MKISKIYLRVCLLLFACFLVCGSILRPVVTYASPYDLLMTDSNALMTMELNDEDYGISTFSSIGNVSNTVDWSKFAVRIDATNINTGAVQSFYPSVDRSSSGISFSQSVSSEYRINYIEFANYSTSGLPPVGIYEFSADYSSHFSVGIKRFELQTRKVTAHASTGIKYCYFNFDQNSGDMYVSPSTIKVTNCNMVIYRIVLDTSEIVRNVGGVLRVSFNSSDSSDPQFSTAVSGSDEQNYQNDVSSSLSDLSSSVDSMTEDLSSAAENLEYISTSQNLIIQGIDNVVMHISDQLFAFWNQLYNLIHVPTMAKMDDIIDAINNMDLEIEVNLDGLKSTINNMSTAIQNKLQSVQNTLTNGFDNSGINQDAAELDQSLQEYEEAEQTVIDQVNDSLNDFEFDSGFEEYTNTIKVFSDFIQDLYEASGGFKVVINLSLMLSIAGIVIGVYRFRDGG